MPTQQQSESPWTNRDAGVPRTHNNPRIPDGYEEYVRVKHVPVNSLHYDQSTGILHVPVGKRNVVHVGSQQAAIPRPGYTFYGGTMQLTYPVSGSPNTYTLTLTAGNYTTSTLATHLQDTIRAEGALSAFTVAFDAVLDKYTFASNDAGTFTVQFTTTMLGYSLGFGRDTIDYTLAGRPRTRLVDTTFPTSGAATTVVSPYRVDLLNGRYMEMHAPELAAQLDNTSLLASVHIVDDMNYDVESDKDLRYFFKTIPHLKTLEIDLKTRLPTGDVEIFDPNGRSFNIVFIVKYLALRKIPTRSFRQ